MTAANSKFRSSKAVRITVVALAAAMLAAVSFFIVTFLLKNVKTGAFALAYYNENGAPIINLDGRTLEIEDKTASGFCYDEKNGRMYYTVASSYSSGTFDLYYTEVKAAGGLTEPKLVDYGIREPYYMSLGGKMLYYTKVNAAGNAVEGCAFDTSKKKITSFAQNVEALYVPENTGEVYFTRLHGENRVLYRYPASGSENAPEELSRNVTTVKLFDSVEAPQLFFETAAAQGVSSQLSVVYPGERPLLVCENAARVLYDDYEADGNLYYFVGDREELSWRQVISDDLSEEDSQLKEPQKSDFFSIFGISFGYSAAKAEYEKKLERDEIRGALDAAFANGSFGAPVYDAYVYNDGGSVKLVDSVNPDEVMAVSGSGEPKIIFESTKVASTDLDISALQLVCDNSGVDSAVEYASEALSGSVVRNGLKIAVYYEGAVSDYEFNGPSGSADILFSQDGKRVFAFLGGEASGCVSVYSSELTEELKPQTLESVDTNVSSYRLDGGSLTYLKLEAGKNYGDVYGFSGGEKVKLSNAAYAFSVREEQGVLSLKNYSGSGEKMKADYYCCTESGEKQVEAGVLVNSVTTGESGTTAFLCPDGKKTALEICVGDKTEKVCENAAQILYVY